MHLRPLPSESHPKLKYLWLVYIASPLSFLISADPGGASPVVPTLLSIAAFLPLYFWGYRTTGLMAGVPIGGMTALGAWLMPLNPGGSVFFLYAGTLTCRVDRPRAGVVILAGIVVVITLERVAGLIATTSWAWTTGATLMFGGLAMYFTEVGRKLKTAQDEARHMAVVAERERIGRDLHDLLGHTLSVIALKSDLAARLARADPDRCLAELTDVQRISREALAQVREAVYPTQALSLARQVSGAEAALTAAGIALDVDLPSITLGVSDERVLAWIVREATTNIIRHASARRCTISVRQDADAVRLEIADDGRGGEIREGTGFRSMRARVADCDGTFEYDSSTGVRLQVTLPAIHTVARVPEALT
ncbi:MAG: sensor histidine kinase [Acidobacteria bacterium]|nr:sensor histidine kinase [Acidobacteriota bacterium]